MCVPVATARRTVRSGRSPYTSRVAPAACHSSASRPMTASDGSRATIAPLSAPTRRAEDEVGIDVALEERLQHADLDGAEHAAATEHERGGHRRRPQCRPASSGCSARIRVVTVRSTQKMISGISPAARQRIVKPMLQPARRDSRNVTTT